MVERLSSVVEQPLVVIFKSLFQNSYNIFILHVCPLDQVVSSGYVLGVVLVVMDFQRFLTDVRFQRIIWIR